MAKKKLADPVSLASYYIESYKIPTHVAALMIFDPPPGGAREFTQSLYEDMLASEVAAPFDMVLVKEPFKLPYLETADNVDMTYHIRQSHLAYPGTMTQLQQMTERLHANVLNRNYPLWECHIIDGLEDGRFALFMKVSHIITDGANAVKRAQASMTTDPTDNTLTGFWGPIDSGRKKKKRKVKPGGTPVTKLPQKLFSIGSGLAGAVARRTFQKLGLQEGSLYVPFTAPATMFEISPKSAARSYGSCQMDFARVKAIGKAHGATINDTVLATVDIALLRYLREHKITPEKPLVLAVPMNLRKPGQESKRDNESVVLMIEMGDVELDPHTRLRTIAAKTNESKNEARMLPSEILEAAVVGIVAGFQLQNYSGWIARNLGTMTQTIVSNVKGVDHSLYMKGARMSAVYPVSMMVVGVNMNITLLTYDGNLNIGVIACREVLPDANKIATYMAEALESLDE